MKLSSNRVMKLSSNRVMTDPIRLWYGKVCDNGPWSKRMFHVAVVFKGQIFILGGFDG